MAERRYLCEDCEAELALGLRPPLQSIEGRLTRAVRDLHEARQELEVIGKPERAKHLSWVIFSVESVLRGLAGPDTPGPA